jgi:hypothetical protein
MLVQQNMKVLIFWGKKKKKQPKPQLLTCFNHVKMEKTIKIIFD